MAYSTQRHRYSSVLESRPFHAGESENVVSFAFDRMARRSRPSRPPAKARELEHELVRLRVAARTRRGTPVLPVSGRTSGALDGHLLAAAVAPKVSALLPPRLRALLAFADVAASSADHIHESDVEGLVEAGLQLGEITMLAKVVAAAIYETSFG